MPFKINIAESNGKTWKLEVTDEALVGRSIGEKIEGKDVSPDLEGYEFHMKGASDIAGFPHKEGLEGPGLQRVLLTKGWGMHNKKRGIRLRKTVRGSAISDKTVQINLTIEKPGKKSLNEIYPDQNKAPEKPKEESKPTEDQPVETETHSEESKTESPKEEPKKETNVEKVVEETKEEIAEEISEEVKEELKDDIPTSPETKTDEEKEEAAEKVAEEVKEEVEEVAEEIAEDEEKEKKE
jgi:ribosomal protein S6E (S10)